MKAIMISIKPEWVEKILNGKKTIEIRKSAPKNFEGWVYIYCTKGKPYLYESEWNTSRCSQPEKGIEYCKGTGQNCISTTILHGTQWGNVLEKRTYKNGKVVARFYLKKVENIYIRKHSYCCDEFYYCTNTLEEDEICKKSRLDNQQLQEYLGDSSGYAWHIDNLEIFDKPKELGEFNVPCPTEKCCKCRYAKFMYGQVACNKPRLTKAPQSWCYVEV